MTNIVDSRLKFKYVKFYFDKLCDYDKTKLLTKKMKDNLICLYEFYLKVDEVVNDNKDKQDVNGSDDIEIDVTFSLNSKDIYRRKIIEKTKYRLK